MIRARSKRVWGRAGLTMRGTYERTRKAATDGGLLKALQVKDGSAQPSSSLIEGRGLLHMRA